MRMAVNVVSCAPLLMYVMAVAAAAAFKMLRNICEASLSYIPQHRSF